MSGIYIHIPFCRQACYYCNFHFSTSLQSGEDMVQAILQEIDLQMHYLPDQEVSTLYFGGGTPSLLPAGDIAKILDKVRRTFIIRPEAEITVEANPDDLSMEKLSAFREVGINRLSIGIQSFADADLQWMHRAHTADQALESIRLARVAGFDNFSVDLIYGLPGLSDAAWQQHVHTVTNLQVPHLSCYALTVEPHTALDHFIRNKQYPPVDPDKAAHQLELLMAWLAKEGYEQYEISNFALPGFHSRHNSSYWEGAHYLGIGPSAHSFNGSSRQWNVANNAGYIQSIREGIVPAQQELLTPVMQLNEYIMTSLRTSKGCDLDKVRRTFGEAAGKKLVAAGEKYIGEGKIISENGCLVLTSSGKLFADGIAAALFFDEGAC